MVDSRTLAELRRHWKNYAEFSNLPAKRLKQITKGQTELSDSVLKKLHFNITPGRSAGMLWDEATVPIAGMFRKYWDTGTIFTSQMDIYSAIRLNPTFVYSLSGEKFNPHYGTFPSGFHLTPAFAPMVDNSKPLPNITSKIINICKQQFKLWCKAFKTARAADMLTIRLYCGDALAFCHALNNFALTNQPKTNLFVAPWRASRIHLDELSTSIPSAPTSFDIIDTSNLTDHLGLINLLIATRPLLKAEPMSQAVLYTETLLPSGDDVTQSFVDRLGIDISMFSTLLGIVPRSYVSGFTTQSNIHELLMAGPGGSPSQFHERVAWTSPTTGDQYALNKGILVGFDVGDLARALYRIYEQMFTNEVAPAILSYIRNMGARFQVKVHYRRETVALLFRIIQRQVYVQDGNWDDVFRAFLQISLTSNAGEMEPFYYQDLCIQLHLHGVCTIPALAPGRCIKVHPSIQFKPSGQSKQPPPLVCVVLTVPRKHLQVLLQDIQRIGQPTLQCILRVGDSSRTHGMHMFCTIHAIWGKCARLPGSDKAILIEDTQGINGTSNLVVMFWVDAQILESSRHIVSLSLKHTLLTATSFTNTLGPLLEIFATSITDQKYVKVLDHWPSLASEIPQDPPSPSPSPSLEPYILPAITKSQENHICRAFTEKRGYSIISLSVIFNLEPTIGTETLASKTINATQIAPCTVELANDQIRHLAHFPYPIQGARHRLHIIRSPPSIQVICLLSWG